MGWIKRIFGTGAADQQERSEYLRDLGRENDDFISGWQLCVTMQTRTPLEWLLRHGEISDDPKPVPMEHAAWIPVMRTWRDLGIDIDEIPPSTMASQVGPIPEDGGEFLKFLIAYRKIIELKQDRWEILSALDKLGAEYPAFEKGLGDGTLSRQFVVTEMLTISGCGRATAQRLYDAGFRSKDEVRVTAVERLMAVPGIGKARAAKLIE